MKDTLAKWETEARIEDDADLPFSRTTKPRNQERTTNTASGKTSQNMERGFTIDNVGHEKQEKPKHRPTELVLDKEAKVPGNWIFQMLGETQWENPKPEKITDRSNPPTTTSTK